MDVERKQRDIAKWSLDEDFRFDDIYNFITYTTYTILSPMRNG